MSEMKVKKPNTLTLCMHTSILKKYYPSVVDTCRLCFLHIVVLVYVCQFAENKERMNMAMLRNIQGLHAPLQLTMELQAANKIGRLPFLPSSGFMSDILMGRDEEMGFEDFLNTVEFREQMAQPHAVLEKQLGFL